MTANVMDQKLLTIVARNARNTNEHRQVHQLMTDNGIPYVILKGYASASYYAQPALRTMGDVDFLIHEDDWVKATEIVTAAGFKSKPDDGGIHVAFHRAPRSTWEMHRGINGANDKVNRYLTTMIEDAHEQDGMMLPSDFHHCLVLLCHTASHLTAEGVGLRHLCDWAVFAHKVDVGRWEAELTDCGLYRFA